jgi:hypothetical protein
MRRTLPLALSACHRSGNDAGEGGEKVDGEDGEEERVLAVPDRS